MLLKDGQADRVQIMSIILIFWRCHAWYEPFLAAMNVLFIFCRFLYFRSSRTVGSTLLSTFYVFHSEFCLFTRWQHVQLSRRLLQQIATMLYDINCCLWIIIALHFSRIEQRIQSAVFLFNDRCGFKYDLLSTLMCTQNKNQCIDRKLCHSKWFTARIELLFSRVQKLQSRTSIRTCASL